MAVETWVTEKQSQLPTQRVRYYQLDGGIHEFVFLEASRAAVDDYVSLLDQLYAANIGQSTTLRFLIDGSFHWIQFLGQMDYLMGCVRNLLAKYPNHPRARTAFLLRDRHRAQTLETSVRLLRSSTEIARCFPVTQPREAIRWLRQLD